MDLLIRHDYTPRQVRVAEAKSNEYKHTRYKSGVANLDDMIELGKAVILCEAHARRFSPKKARYRAHPDKKLRRVFGNCDVCRVMELAYLFLNEKDALEEQRKLEKFLRGIEYSAHVS